jgi:hypothetical protein
MLQPVKNEDIRIGGLYYSLGGIYCLAWHNIVSDDRRNVFKLDIGIGEPILVIDRTDPDNDDIWFARVLVNEQIGWMYLLHHEVYDYRDRKII